MTKNKFSPLYFLASLGAGGIAVSPFAFLQYTIPHPNGLIYISQLKQASLPFLQNLFFGSLEAVMIVFTILHFILSFVFFKKLIPFLKDKSYSNFINDPLQNAAILAPFLSIVMTMNVFIGPIRFFIPVMAENLQVFMLPALVFWIFLFVLHLRMEIKLLKISFAKGFDISKITFGWLLHPFALGMLTVVGTGIAALSKDSGVADIAAFLTFISGSMGLFLFLVKIIAVFQKHFASDCLGEKQFLPSFLIVIPSITLYAISAFRIGHYLEKHHGFHLDSYFLLVIGVAFAFETWYLLFGLALLKDYFKKHYFKKEFYVTQWSLICPFVAYAVLATFTYETFRPSWIFIAVFLLFLVISVVFYFDLLIRNLKCARVLKKKVEC